MNYKSIKYSLVIPVYNVEKFLSKCLESILSQNISNYEIILVDDGSTDRSGSISDEYRERYPNKIRVIHKKNEGLISARVVGRQHARGEYIWHIDSDDFINPHSLEKIDEKLSSTNADLLIFNFQVVDEEDNIINFSQKDIFPKEEVNKQLLYEKYVDKRINALWRKVARRSLFDLNSDFREYYSITIAEDLLQSIMFSRGANNICYYNEALYSYRSNKNSVTHNFYENEYKMLEVISPLLFDCIREMGFLDKDMEERFYKSELRGLLQIIMNASKSNISEEKYFCILDKIYMLEHVKKAKEFFPKTDVRIEKEIALRLFYKKHWKCLRKYIIYLRKIYRLLSRL